jgi:hypothetical protein
MSRAREGTDAGRPDADDDARAGIGFAAARIMGGL